MVRAAWAGAEDADAVVHLIDAEAELAAAGPSGKPADRRAADDVRTATDGLKAARKAILALNKIDRVRRDDLLALTQRLFESEAYAQVFMISALDGSGVEDLKHRLATLMPEGPWLYPKDQSADLPAQLLAAEITREKVYLRVHQELPYAVNVETTAFEERQDGSARLEQTIFVERESQRAILIGKGGQTLRWIGEASRKELGVLLDRPIHLFLVVKVRENWAEERSTYTDLGLEYDV
jgi:GTP-binding protein Era